MLKVLFKIVILLCPLDTPVADCDATNAIDVIHSPGRYATPMQCLADGTQTLASTALNDPKTVRIKILCPREFDVAGGSAH